MCETRAVRRYTSGKGGTPDRECRSIETTELLGLTDYLAVKSSVAFVVRL